MSTHLSRRDFLARTGSGAALAVGAGIVAALKAGRTVAAVRSYDTATLALALDGQFAGYPRDVEGGVTDISTPFSSTSVSTLPLVLRFAGGVTRPFIEWMPSILMLGGMPPPGRSLNLFTFSPATMKELYRLSLAGARIALLETPLCDAASQENVCFRIVITAENAQQFDFLGGTTGGSLAVPATRNVPLVASNFRLDIGGSGPKIAFRARRVLPLEIRRNSNSLNYRISQLRVSMRRAEAAPFHQWLDQQRQSTGSLIERPGVLTLLAPDRSSVLASIDLPALSIARVGMPGEDGSGPDSVEVTLNCRSAAMNLAGLAA